MNGIPTQILVVHQRRKSQQVPNIPRYLQRTTHLRKRELGALDIHTKNMWHFYIEASNTCQELR